MPDGLMNNATNFLDAVVFGNATLDVICRTVDEVPRHESIAFDEVLVSPGGCGSNTALGLAALGVATGIIACLGADDAADLVQRYWRRAGLDMRWVRTIPAKPTGTSVGLVDSDAQPRFIHTSGANAHLTPAALDIPAITASGARHLHIAGYFVLPGVLEGSLRQALAQARQAGLRTSLDVVRSPRMAHPASLWSTLPEVDVFLCNAAEAARLSGERKPPIAARLLRGRGAGAVVVKSGAQGAWLDCDAYTGEINGEPVTVVDTTGAGDAFAAGMIAALLGGASLAEACRVGNLAGAWTVSKLGALAAWNFGEGDQPGK